MRRQADINGKHPELFQHVENARLCRDRQRKQHQIDPGAAGEFNDVVDLSKFRLAGTGVERARVVAIIEHAEDLNIGVVLRVERADQVFTVLVGADDDRPAVEAAFTRPAADHRAQNDPVRKQRTQSDEEKG